MPGVFGVPKGYAWLVERAIRDAVAQARRFAAEDGEQFSTADPHEPAVEVIVRPVAMADGPLAKVLAEREKAA